MKYPILLFDADDTLFDFPAASERAFDAMCRANDIPNTPVNHMRYCGINDALWWRFARGEVTKEYLILERYVRWLKALGLDRDPAKCNDDYIAALGQTVIPLPHAEAVCRELAARGHRLFLITNAVAAVQRSRLKLCPFGEVFEAAFISEEAGAAKPSAAYFDYVRAHVPEICAENTLVIGDSLATDIRGANNAGLPACWANFTGSPRPGNLRIDCEIHDLRELLDIV